jgi:GGDEF domain-containing protein
LHGLADAAKDDAAESASVQEITRGVRAKMNELAATIDLRRQGHTEQAMVIVREGRGRRLMVAIHAEATRMLARAAACGREQVAIVRKRLMAAIDELNQSRKEPFQLSVSVGESIYDPQAPSTLEDLMESADRAMYEEKRARGQRTASRDPHCAPSPRE